MLQAIIESIDYTKNVCTVNIPSLRPVTGANPVVRSAVIACTPGVIHGYKVGDRVWVGFINDQYEFPVILGKLTNASTALEAGGTFKGQSVVVSDSATLPSTINFTGVDADYNSLDKIIYKLKQATSFTTKHNGLDYQLKELSESAGSGDNGGGSVVVPDQEAVVEAVQSAVDSALWSTITAVLTYADWQRIADAGGFDLGKILFVKNDLNKDYYYRAKVDIYPVYSPSVNYTKESLIEFSNVRHYNKFDKLPGNWYIKAYFNGGILVQRWDTEEETAESSFYIGAAECALFKTVEDPNHVGATITEPLSWYWDAFNGVNGGLKSVLSRDLIFRDADGIDIRESTQTDIFRIDVPGDLPGDPSIPVQKFGKDDATRYDNLAILNVRDAKFLTNKQGKSCRFQASYIGISIFHSVGSNNSTKGIEYVYLPDEYNKIYRNNELTAITNYLFGGANHLTYVRIPTTTGVLYSGSFGGTGSRAQKPLEIVNLENSQVSVFDSECFQNPYLKNACLYLPRLPGPGTIKFLEGAISYRFWTSQAKEKLPIKTFFVQSPVDFNYNENGDAHNGSFKVHEGRTDYINRYLKELVYYFDGQDTIETLKNSKLCAFFTTSLDYQVEEAAVTTMLDEFADHVNNNTLPADGRLILELETTSPDIKIPVHFVDASIATDVKTGEATELTIIYNYTKNI